MRHVQGKARTYHPNIDANYKIMCLITVIILVIVPRPLIVSFCLKVTRDYIVILFEEISQWGEVREKRVDGKRIMVMLRISR